MTVIAIAAALGLVACGDDGPQEAPGPFALTEEAVGRYCGMNVIDHPGPKGQIILGAIPEPIWFSSARDAVAFTMLAEEPKNVAAIYVSDMAKAPSWQQPGPENWIEARAAFYVIGSAVKGGMGALETVPFSTRATAEAFSNENGGQVVVFDEIPTAYVLGSAGSEPAATDTVGSTD
ncbi:nitrous oxide reductase accessory protein NosL [Aquibium sp. A9E412]|uniref:nitrous oxide reductase accessory protein NosL n=1 Tax=Aquibium sp. A9E412 TaxID=2976767 RepID=UPI0025B11140|nr:nitrous oxide reductase accessory protein NosL [Aquibium sp. A9E412]MDN2565778.1 nitrous oxide reductase accessory protein NosL [Aquibium sp. A9E412]